MLKRFTFIILALSLNVLTFLHAIEGTEQSLGLPKTVNQSAYLEKRHNKVFPSLPQFVQEVLKKDFIGYRAMSYASGSFINGEGVQYAVLLFDSNQKREVLSVINRVGKNMGSINLISKNTTFWYVIDEKVTAESLEIYKKHLGIAVLQNPVSKLNVVCHGAETDGLCYQFDPSKNSFEEIGSWAT